MRVYQGDSIIAGETQPHTFIEIKNDSFLEVDLPRLSKLTKKDKQNLNTFVEKIKIQEEETSIFHMRMAQRYFTVIYPVPNLRLVGTF